MQIDLNGTWELCHGEQNGEAPSKPADLKASGWEWIAASVPGNVELDLAAAGQLPAHLHRGDRIYAVQAFEKCRWWYRRSFASPALRPGQQAVLVFGGIDCIAEIFLNGESIGTARNMLVEHSYDVTARLKRDSANELLVRIDSPTIEARKHRPGSQEFAFGRYWEALPIRKAPHMYGWDIMPRVVSAGLWRGVSLDIREPNRIEEVYWRTLSVNCANRTAELAVDWQLDLQAVDLAGWTIRLALACGADAVHSSTQPAHTAHGRARIALDNAEFWWPRGAGTAAMYDATAELVAPGGEVVSRCENRIGIRTVELRRTDVTGPECGEFLFAINGRPIYCRGTNHVPLDALHSRDVEHVDAATSMMADLNCNMVRCWGGNVYEDHVFFDRCDSLGIMVWQDFAMACAIYPQSQDFAAVIRDEAESVVRKLRNHPSLVLWAGNNEIDLAYGWAGHGIDPNTDVPSRQVLPDVVRRLDPCRPYLPSSPYYSPELIRRGGDSHLAPEDHLWGPRDDFKGAFYTSSPAHFVSEIGYHGCPNRETMEAMMEPDNLWPWQDNGQWLTHAVRPMPDDHRFDYRIPLMASQIRVLFDADPGNLDDFIAASQASQAEALKFFIERWRMGKWRRTGMLWWNLRDGWPVISDAIVDYFGRRKLAYEVVKRLQADLCVCVAEPESGQHAVHAVNDTASTISVRVTVQDVDTSAVLMEADIAAGPDASVRIGSIPASKVPAMWVIRWQGRQATGVNHYLAGARPFKLSDYTRWLGAVGLGGR